MQTDQMKEALARFYGGVSPPPELANRLRALAEVDLAPARPDDARFVLRGAADATRRWHRGLLGVAACLGMTLTFAAGYQVGVDRSRLGLPPIAAGLQPQQSLPQPTHDTLAQGKPAEAPPGLVAVRLHADWCPRCPTIAPIYKDLEQRFGSEPVLFVTLDLTTAASRKQARLMADSLGVANALQEPRGPGQIKLIDRSKHEMLAVIEGLADQKNWEDALAQALPKEPL